MAKMPEAHPLGLLLVRVEVTGMLEGSERRRSRRWILATIRLFHTNYNYLDSCFFLVSAQGIDVNLRFT